MLSTLSEQERTALTIYNQMMRAGDYDDAELWVDNFSYSIFSTMPQGAVIDVGCRIGRVISILPDLGISEYFGIDPSKEHIEYCKKKFPQYDFAVGELRTLGREYPGRFAGFIMLAVLMHLPRSEVDAALASLRACLLPNAQGFFSTPMGKRGILEFENGAGMLLTLFTPEEVRCAFERNGFKVVRTHSPDGHMLVAHIQAR